MRIGIGYDAHKLDPGRPLILGGVTIPHTHGLLGHSDADVLIHAIIDSLLGAAKLGDIGRLFPDNDARCAGIQSTKLLRQVKDLLQQGGFSVLNIDSTIIAQNPHLAPFTAQMEQNVAACLGIDTSSVSVKATTEEHMGFTGRNEGIAAHAIALIGAKI